MIWVFIGLAVLLGIWAFVHYRSNKKPSVSNETNLAIIKYENFGHNFSIADLVNTELKKIDKPEYTSWEWETFTHEGKTSEKRLRIKLISLLDTEKKVSGTFSLEKSSDYWYDTPYSDAYIRNDGMVTSRYYSDAPVKDVVRKELVEKAQQLVIKFKTDYKDTEFGSDLNGVI